ncbi:hypothetical protein FisN_35Lh018 [Fistulifera solaris]|uniref:CSC1/OSCA1-like 7TM region domain-containing protein n=1 Tax=Fistulifera solaris TaxID=1519565 RepID=A0A1Z5KR84_FISSO|nr:hypothetical protein FisN_35Lh018 [Fistulifera solaris]|eukprot:GAX28816.1 hypothetical protein FisN_35Lh018 [Fistulifera solaris]
MTTLSSLGFTLVGAGGMGAIAITLFGFAVKRRSPFVAPRATARPASVIYRGERNPWTGWIPETMNWTYHEMLQGVAGTGTRKQGKHGRLLNVTLDGIVVLRFHALCMRVALFATVLFLCILLPLYATAGCADAPQWKGCAGTNGTFTDYERLTMANIPSVFTPTYSTKTTGTPDVTSVRARLFTVVLVFWMLVIYTCWQLRQEWREILAMRRVYYLEHDVWGARQEELKETLLYKSIEPIHHRSNKSSSTHCDQDEPHLIHRDPWIPHPEPRETVPNVALYSLLVGCLPSLPDHSSKQQALHAEQDQQQPSSLLDWQLEMAVTFFDHCIPNNPGFSSSVAAVTIMPSPQLLSKAWRKWYTAAGKLRRLRFIRDVIAKRRKYEIAMHAREEADIERGDRSDDRGIEQAKDAFYDRDEKCDGNDDLGVDSEDTFSPPFDLSDNDPSHPNAGIYQDPTRYKDYYRAVLGILDENDDIYEFLKFGPEQAAVYSREFAQAAAPCCPRGCFESYIRDSMSIDELVDLEQELAEQVHAANLELKRARQKAAALQVPENSPSQQAALIESSSVSLPRLNLEGSRHPQNTISRKSERRSKPTWDYFVSRDNTLEAKLYQKRIEKSQSEITPNTKSGAALRIETLPSVESAEYQEQQEESSSEWDQVVALLQEQQQSVRSSSGSMRLPDGRWQWPSWKTLWGATRKTPAKAWRTNKAVVESLSRDSTYAVVTFTSRQAAIAARHCLTDGRAANRWLTLEELPIPPLADAPSCNIMACRNCCRPLALGANERQKNIRFMIALAMLAVIYTLYTIPLTAASEFFSPSQLNTLFPELKDLSDQYGWHLSGLLSGLISAIVYTTFFALCPVLFKAIANFGSKATSVAGAEFRALQYYWWFMVLTAFSGQILAKMTLSAFNEGLSVGSDLQSIVRDISQTIPSKVAPMWLNWILFRMLAVLPFQYLLQVNTFLFSFFRMHCCARMVMGGGPGCTMPYRIYVDSGVVFMCIYALGPAVPLVAPAAFAYFFVCQPLLRRNLIFVYRPKYDGGGLRWPFLFDMTISSMMLGSILLAGQMGLKEGLVPAGLAASTMFPILLFQRDMQKCYHRAFQDAALLQTSLLDGWNATQTSSMIDREEFRRFLVDAHKAAYVPVCLAATDTDDFLTAEPALVVPLETDSDASLPKATASASSPSENSILFSPDSASVEMREFRSNSLQRRSSQQFGATLRRMPLMASTQQSRFAENTPRFSSSSQLSNRPRMSSFSLPKPAESSFKKPLKSV